MRPKIGALSLVESRDRPTYIGLSRPLCRADTGFLAQSLTTPSTTSSPRVSNLILSSALYKGIIFLLVIGPIEIADRRPDRRRPPAWAWLLHDGFIKDSSKKLPSTGFNVPRHSFKPSPHGIVAESISNPIQVLAIIK